MYLKLFKVELAFFNVVIPKNHANAQVTDPRLTISHPIWPWPSICLSVICIFAYMIQQQNSLRCVWNPSFPNGSMQSQSAMHFAFPIRCIEACTVCFFLSDEWPDLLRFFRFERHFFFAAARSTWLSLQFFMRWWRPIRFHCITHNVCHRLRSELRRDQVFCNGR